jgi:hypothetical protein
MSCGTAAPSIAASAAVVKPPPERRRRDDRLACRLAQALQAAAHRVAEPARQAHLGELAAVVAHTDEALLLEPEQELDQQVWVTAAAISHRQQLVAGLGAEHVDREAPHGISGHRPQGEGRRAAPAQRGAGIGEPVR